MQSTESLSRIGQDISRIFFNNAGSLEDINDTKTQIPSNISSLNDTLKHHVRLIRQDLHDILQANRELLALLHLGIKDFSISKKDLDSAYDLMQPDELNELPKMKVNTTDNYFANEGKLPFAIWKRMKGELN